MKSIVIAAMLTGGSAAAVASPPDTVFLEELTWTEVRDAIDAGTTTIIVPTAGTEQNGPHMVLGKHKYRINAASERIARALGHTLVAPVMTYVPEGEIEPPSGHMRYAGTISIPVDVFEATLEYTARSLRVHGFTDILFIGDSGPNQGPMQVVATVLNAEWQGDPTRVHFISDWYTSTTFEEWLLEKGETAETMGQHAGLVDTSLLLAVAPQHVRIDKRSVGQGSDVDGVTGDPTKATAEIGKVGMDFYFEDAMQQIRDLMRGN